MQVPEVGTWPAVSKVIRLEGEKWDTERVGHSPQDFESNRETGIRQGRRESCRGTEVPRSWSVEMGKPFILGNSQRLPESGRSRGGA